jgi:UDP-hydrolysing UDP-N-acetyl-D-glucosamine 2-epimerase
MDAKKRLVKMGEIKKNIYIVGCPSLDALFSATKLDCDYILRKFNIDLKKNFILVIQHPVTSEDNYSGSQIIETIKAVKKTCMQALFILPNNDSGHDKIIKIITQSKIKWTESLSLNEYFTLLSHAKLLVGNSSSGIHEAASFKLPVVNIGTRQNGRLKPPNVIDADYYCDDIYKKINFCLFNKKFIRSLKSLKNPYGDGQSSNKIANILGKINLSKSTQKQNTY